MEGIYDWKAIEEGAPPPVAFAEQPVVVEPLPSEEPLIQIPTPQEHIAPMPPVPGRRHNSNTGAYVAIGSTVAVVAALVGVSFIGNSSPKHSSPKTEQPAPKPKKTPPAIAPAETFGADYDGYACDSQTAEIEPGNSDTDTVFGLTTVGLKSDPPFEDAIFEWNLEYLQSQAQTNSALSNPNNIATGVPFKIHADCIGYNPVQAFGQFELKDGKQRETMEYQRELDYQDYKSANGSTHHLVTVYYDSNKEGDFLKVLACDPSPNCYAYVTGAPKHPPKNFYP